MSTTSVLYDEPGPRARRRSLIGTVIGVVAIAALVGLAIMRLVDQEQFTYDKWGPLIDPGNENFADVWALLGQGLVTTLTGGGTAIVLSLIFGVILGVARMLLGRGWNIPVVGFIEIFRALPVVVTMFAVWQIFPEIGIDLGFLPGNTNFWYMVTGLVLYNSVIFAEILRAGVNALPTGQAEAALAVGMNRGQVMRFVQLPQAFRTMLPALISQLIVVIKDTSLAGLLALTTELLKRGLQVSNFLDNPLQTLFIVALIFITLNYALSRLATWLEGRSAARTSGGGAAVQAAENAVPVT